MRPISPSPTSVPTCARPPPRQRPNWWPSRANSGWRRWTCWSAASGTARSASSMRATSGSTRRPRGWADRPARSPARRCNLPPRPPPRALARLAQRMRHGVLLKMQQLGQTQQALQTQLPQQLRRRLGQHAERLERTALHLELLDPRLVLQRGYALLTDTGGQAVTRVRQARPGAALCATLAGGTVDVTVAPRSGAGVPSRQ